MTSIERIFLALSLIMVIGFSALTVDLPTRTTGYLTGVTEIPSTVTSDSKITSYTWNFGDGTIVTTPYNYPKHVYKDKTDYLTVSLTVKNQAGETASDSMKIYLVPLKDGNTGAKSTSFVTEHLWDLGGEYSGTFGIQFGTGFGSGCKDTIRIYSSVDGTNWNLMASYDYTSIKLDQYPAVYGSYNPYWQMTYKELSGYFRYLKLTANKNTAENVGCYMDYSLVTLGRVQDLPAYIPVKAEAGADINVYKNQIVTFSTAGSAGEGLAYSWNYGDDESGIRGIHTYSEAGTYTATLTVTDKFGNKNTDTVTVAVTEMPPIDNPATADAGADKTADVGQTVNFAGTATGDAPLTYFWNFGDGGEISASNPTGHTYVSAGTYTVNFTVTDIDGDTDSDTATVTVNALPPATHPTTADAGTDKTADVGETITFTGFGTGDGALTYLWTFGDGSTAATSTAIHAYSAAGVYTATLTVTDADGHPASDFAIVTINAITPAETPVTANAGADQTTQKNTELVFAGSGTGDGTLLFSWNFGDGKTATGTIVTHKFTTDGTKTVTLTVTDEDGDTASDTAIVTVSRATDNYYVSPQSTNTNANQNQQALTLSKPLAAEEDVVITDTEMRSGESFTPEITADADSISVLFDNKEYDMHYSASKKAWYVNLETPAKNGKYEITFTLKKGDQTQRVRKTITVDSSGLKVKSTGPSGTVNAEKQTIYVKVDQDDANCRYSADEDADFEDMKSMKEKSGNYFYKEVTAQEGDNTYYILCEDSDGKLIDAPEEVSFMYGSEAAAVQDGSTQTGMFGMDMGSFTLSAGLAAVLLIGAGAYLFLLKE